MRYCDRRGHGKLRLCSRKYHRPRPKRPRSFPISIPLRNITVLKVSIPLNVLSFKVLYPRAAYSDGSVETVDNLHHRIQCSRELPSGDEFLSVFITKYLFDLGWMLAMENKSLSVFCVHVPAQGPPEYTFAVTIQENFSWIVYYRGQLVNCEYCMLLQKIPCSVNSGM